MTESAHDAAGDALFAHIRQMVTARGGSEFLPQDSSWHSPQHGELPDRLGALLEKMTLGNFRVGQDEDILLIGRN